MMAMETRRSLKQDLLDALARMDDSASFEEILDRMFLIHGIRKGMEQADQGILIPHDEVVKQSDTWLR